MLHAEEGLWLVERGMLAVRPFRTGSGEGHGTHITAATTATASVTPPESALLKPADVGGATNEHGQATASCSRPSMSMGMTDQGRREDQEAEARNREKQELPGPDGSLDSRCSSQQNSLDPPRPRAGCIAEPSNRKWLPEGSSEMTTVGDPRHKPALEGSREPAREAQQADWSRTTAVTTVPGVTQRRVGNKRGRSGSGGSERGRGEGIPTPSVPVGVLYEVVLSRAGVPWECYRAFAELKQR